jgi:hypothetical protein
MVMVSAPVLTAIHIGALALLYEVPTVELHGIRRRTTRTAVAGTGTIAPAMQQMHRPVRLAMPPCRAAPPRSRIRLLCTISPVTDPDLGKVHFDRLDDGADEELIVCALLHDVGETLGPLNHGQVGAALLRPFVSEQNHWVLVHHAIFQTYFCARHLGLDPTARDRYKESPRYQACVDVTTNWDEVSFDPKYRSEPLSTFEPMVRRVLVRPWAPPGAA